MLVQDENAGEIMGLWDLSRSPPSVGGGLMLAAELKARAVLEKSSVAGVCFIGSTMSRSWTETDLNEGLKMGNVYELSKSSSTFLSALLEIDQIDRIFMTPDLHAMKVFLTGAGRSCRFWPREDDHQYAYVSTLYLQQFYKEHRWIPSLHMKSSGVRWAWNFYQKYLGACLPMVVHLKNNPREVGCSNANVSVWRSFFEKAQKHKDVRFVLVGNDEINSEILNLPNVVATQTRGGTLARDLAIVETAPAFMGMASGPSTMALFHPLPYRIYKHPDHHASEMKEELGSGDRLAFATPHQRILRELETVDRLWSDLQELLAAIRRDEWMAQAK